MISQGKDWRSYTAIASRGKLAEPRPLIRLTLQAGTRRVQPLALVDSGSDESVLPPALARRLGLWPSVPALPLDVIGGDVLAGVVHADIRIALHRGPLVLPSVPFRVPLVGDRPQVVVLGRRPLFEAAEITFQEWASRFCIASRHDSWWLKPRPMRG